MDLHASSRRAPRIAVLTAIKRRGGYTQTLQYNASNQLSSVTNSYGRTLQFTFQNGLLSTMTAPDGGVYQYLYQPRDPRPGLVGRDFPQLVRVVKPGQSPTSPPQNYLYENAAYPAALTGIVDEMATASPPSAMSNGAGDHAAAWLQPTSTR